MVKERNYLNENIFITIFAFEVLAILAFILVFAFTDKVPLLGVVPPVSQEHREYTETEATNRDEERSNSISVIGVDGKSGTPEHQKEAAEPLSKASHRAEFVKDKRDLNAQEGMWRAAKALVFLTFLQIIVGAGTLYFLIKTFQTQRSELGAARRATEAAENAARAIVMLDFQTRFVTQAGESSDHKEFFKIQPVLKNIGKTPAKGVSFKFARLLTTNEGELFYDDHRSQSGFEGFGENRFVSGEKQLELAPLGITFETSRCTGKPRTLQRRNPRFWTECIYTDVFNVEWVTTSHATINVESDSFNLEFAQCGDADKIIPHVHNVIATFKEFITETRKEHDKRKNKA